MKHSNNHNYPSAIADAITLYDKPPWKGDISNTTLTMPPRIKQLKQRHRHEIQEDLSDFFAMFLGSAVHDYIARRSMAPHRIIEKAFYYDIDGTKVGGIVDLYDTKTFTQDDYKVVRAWSFLNGMKPEYEQQLNINTWLLRKNGHKVDRHRIVALYRDWSEGQAYNKSYPQSHCVAYEAPIWKDTDAEAWIRERVELHKDAEKLPDDELPHCSSAERWEKPEKYAVMKKGRKSAVRVLDTWEEADAYMNQKGYKNPSHWINIRQGEFTRCEKWCQARPFCNLMNEEEPPF